MALTSGIPHTCSHMSVLTHACTHTHTYFHLLVMETTVSKSKTALLSIAEKKDLFLTQRHTKQPGLGRKGMGRRGV